jgi:hypothetical protein
MDIWELLEQDAPSCENVKELYHWSLNYDAGKGPFTLFLDMIGWSQDELGCAMYDLNDASLGYLELCKLTEALNEYTDNPTDVMVYVNQLIKAESVDA